MYNEKKGKMNHDYKPGLNELAKEMTLGFGRFVHSNLVGIVVGSTALFYTPTMVRVAKRKRNYEESSDPIGNTGAGIGGFIGVLSFFTTALYLCERGYYKFLAVPLATNFISGAYELHRSARKRLIERHSESNLDNFLRK